MSLLFSVLSGFVIAFSPRSEHLLNFMAAANICSDFGTQENKICHCFRSSPFYLPPSDGPRRHDLSCLFFLMLSFSSSFFAVLFQPLSQDKGVVPEAAAGFHGVALEAGSYVILACPCALSLLQVACCCRYCISYSAPTLSSCMIRPGKGKPSAP